MSNIKQTHRGLQVSTLIGDRYAKMEKLGFSASFPLTKDLDPDELFLTIIKKGDEGQHIALAKSFEIKDLRKLPKRLYLPEQLEKIAYGALTKIEGLKGIDIPMKESIAKQFAFDHPYLKPLDYVFFVEAVRISKYKTEYEHISKGITQENINSWMLSYVSERSELLAQEQRNEVLRRENAKMDVNAALFEKFREKRIADKEIEDDVNLFVSNQKVTIDSYFNHIIWTRLIYNKLIDQDKMLDVMAGVNKDELHYIKKSVINAVEIIESNIMKISLPSYFSIDGERYEFWGHQFKKDDWRDTMRKFQSLKMHLFSYQTYQAILTARFLEKESDNVYLSIIDIITKGKSENENYNLLLAIDRRDREAKWAHKLKR